MFWKRRKIEIPKEEIDKLLSLMNRRQLILFKKLHHRVILKDHDTAFVIKTLHHMYTKNMEVHSGKTEREVLLEKFSKPAIDKILEIYDKYIKSEDK